MIMLVKHEWNHCTDGFVVEVDEELTGTVYPSRHNKLDVIVLLHDVGSIHLQAQKK